MRRTASSRTRDRGCVSVARRFSYKYGPGSLTRLQGVLATKVSSVGLRLVDVSRDGLLQNNP